MTSPMWPLVLTLAASSTATTTPSFCQRMAAELPMKEKRVAGTVRAFDLQMATLAQRLFLGGTISFSMKLEAIEDTPEERRRVDDMCSSSPCTLEGPLRFTLRVKDGAAYPFEAAAGERARVELVGTRVRCSDL